MMLHIPGVLTRDQVAECRQLLAHAQWTDGRATAGAQGASVKRNLQLPLGSPEYLRLGEIVTRALEDNPAFFSAALPLRIAHPMFNRYEGGGQYGLHVDSAMRIWTDQHGATQTLRTDVSSTLFFSDPDEYEGGELTVVDTYGTHEVKLPAGDLIVYPATSLHEVQPVTRGARLGSFVWTQSMVRDDWKRSLLYELDQTIQRLRANTGETDESVAFTAHYHNLLRLWTEV